MPIPMPDQSQAPAQDIVHRLIPGESASDFVLALKNAMVAAGWTATELRAWHGLRLREAVGDGSWVRIDNRTYTFKTAINNANPREVLLDNTGDWSGSFVNLVHAVHDDGIGKGTLYSSATTAHPTCDTEVLNGGFYVWYKTPGLLEIG